MSFGGYASACQLKRVLGDSEWEAMGLSKYADEVLEQRGTCRASDEEPHIPIAGADVASAFN